MRARLKAVDDARGVRLPRAVVEACGFGDAVEMTVEGDRLVLSRVAPAREGWAEAFEAMAEAGDDAPLLPEGMSEAADADGWRW